MSDLLASAVTFWGSTSRLPSPQVSERSLRIPTGSMQMISVLVKELKGRKKRNFITLQTTADKISS